MAKNILECAKRQKSKTCHEERHVVVLCVMNSDSKDVLILRDLSMVVLSYAGLLKFSEVNEQRVSDITFHSVVHVLGIAKPISIEMVETFILPRVTSTSQVSKLLRYTSYTGIWSESVKYLFRAFWSSRSGYFTLRKDKMISYAIARECIVARLNRVALHVHFNLGMHMVRASGATATANSNSVSERCHKWHGQR